MKREFEEIVLRATGASAITSQQVVQTLWSGYGEIVKVGLAGGGPASAILKYIAPPAAADHPRGWHGERSHARKVRSYAVEMAWYRAWSGRCGDACRVPACYALHADGHEQLMVLEDLDAAGFSLRKSDLNKVEVKRCLSWLADFHATFMGQRPDGLWPVGTYWHLATRPDELAAMSDRALKGAAARIDQLLSDCPYQTLVHGDAKVANFCFSADGRRVAGVDFQYVGGGCGMKDVAYLLGSCLSGDECERWEGELLDHYFERLRQALKRSPGTVVEADGLEASWRALYPLAWTDFHRFLQGWAPTHKKINGYSERLVAAVLRQL